MFDWLSNPQAWIALGTLTMLELVLGIDNIIFISILVDRLPPEKREAIRKIGLFMAMFMRLALLATLSWMVGLTKPLFTVFGWDVTGRALILFLGGLFLVWKSTTEIHGTVEHGGEDEHGGAGARKVLTVGAALVQIIILDLVFSLDSIITAVGMVDDLGVMMTAVVLSVALMMLFAGPIGRFVSAHPTIKVLALSFLVVVGVVLIADAFGQHVPKGYIYFAMAFSVAVEMLNIRLRKRADRPVELISAYEPRRSATAGAREGDGPGKTVH